ncbi:hypothetical protein TNCV_3440301 [Trichonephila clavipes]|uniref:Uncharacterized protein n=1 Tax=Trichonephila clavipes TaxID=2585209 RepID=A0A8X6W5L0_TRICX|nr:hypothetical protein TNCV_3440301 [Trichonephila clavipes]
MNNNRITTKGDVNRKSNLIQSLLPSQTHMVAVVEWYRYRIVACLVTSSSPVPRAAVAQWLRYPTMAGMP